MDRQLVYPGAIPLETDILNGERNGMVAVAALASALFGTTTTANNLPVTPTSPASMSVQVGAGELYAVANLDSTAFSSLPADTAHQIVKQGINLDAVTLPCAAPNSAGQSICYLIEAGMVEADNASTVLPYYNASNPSTAWSGPANTGTAQPTKRSVSVNIIAKPGTAAATGSQTAPATDAGFIALAVVTVAYGQTTITAANIAVPQNAPVVPPGGILAALEQISYASRAVTAAGTSTNQGVTPDGLAQAVQGGSFLYAVAAGTATAINAPLSPAPAALQAGMELVLKCTTTTTGAATLNLNGLGAKPVTYAGAALAPGAMVAGQLYLLIFDGGSWQLQTPQMAGVVKALLAPNGYRIWSNGQIDQWGTVSLGAGGSNTVIVSLAFPIPFPNAVWSLTGNGDNSAVANTWAPLVVVFPATTLTGSNVIADTANSQQSMSAGRNVRWAATGN